MNPVDVGRQLLDEDLQVIGWHDGHADTRVLRAHGRRHGEVIVKVHRDRLRHEREVHAYRTWVPTLGDRAPILIASHDDPPAICTTALPGLPLADATPSSNDEYEAHRQAGLILAAYHRSAPPVHDPSRVGRLANRGRYWLSRADGLIDARERQTALDDLEALEQLAVHTVVPSHLDFTPGNLIIDAHGKLRVIDFEHSRLDLAARDLVRLATRVWPHRPDLEHAFISTYGRLSDLDREVITRYATIDRISSIISRATAARAGGRAGGRR